MANLFSGIITSEFKQLFNDAISALLYDSACTLSCTLYYGITKHEACANCVYDSIGQKSANRYQDGGPAPFPFGTICPMCDGRGKRGVESTEDINLMVIWNYREFIDVGTINNPAGTIQTLTFDEHTPKLKRAKELVVATDITNYSNHRFQRISEPQPCGLGNTEFVSCLWERVAS